MRLQQNQESQNIILMKFVGLDTSVQVSDKKFFLGIIFRFLTSRIRKGALHVTWEGQWNKKLCGVKVVLTGFVNNPDVFILGGARIRKNLVNLPDL